MQHGLGIMSTSVGMAISVWEYRTQLLQVTVLVSAKIHAHVLVNKRVLLFRDCWLFVWPHYKEIIL